MKVVKLKENDEYIEVNNKVYNAKKLIEFLQSNPYPKDDQVHGLANILGVEHKEIEQIAYALLSTFFCGGNSKGQSIDISEAEYNKSIEIEYEHTDKNSIYADLISRKIAMDHEFEFPNNYYLTGIDLAGQEEKVKSLMVKEN